MHKEINLASLGYKLEEWPFGLEIWNTDLDMGHTGLLDK